MSVTHAAGFAAAGVVAGLKSTGRSDVALVQNLGPSFAAAAVFTSNRAKANPILWSQTVIGDGIVNAIVLNSGGANCYTGSFGFQTSHLTAEAVGGPGFALTTPRGVWATLLYWGLLGTAALATAVPLRDQPQTSPREGSRRRAATSAR